MKLSVVIPAYNEEACIQGTVRALYSQLEKHNIKHEIIVVNDNSKDRTRAKLEELFPEVPSLRIIDNTPPNGFGFAVRKGLESFEGDAVAIYMADASDSPEDLVLFFNKLCEGYDCVFGTRWRKGGRVYAYPVHKRYVNRLANHFINFLFQCRYDDTTNAFKLYRREVINGIQPLLSYHFNLTVELPLKAMVRGYKFAVVPNSWTNRKYGISNLRIREMGSRYLFVVLYCLLEKWLSRNDYHKNSNPFAVPRVSVKS
jgi:dolichol-phosphate mannosyltransferase